MKVTKLIYLLLIILCVIKGINNNLFLVIGFVNLIIFIIFFKSALIVSLPQVKGISKVGLNYIVGIYNNDIKSLFRKYNIDNYLFILMFLYFVLAIFDNMFVGFLYLNVYFASFFLMLSFVVNYSNIINLNVKIGSNKLSLQDLLFLISFVLSIYLGVSLKFHSIYLPFFLGFLFGLLLYVILLFSTKTFRGNFIKLKSVQFFVVLITITFLITLFVDYLNIKRLFTREKIVYKEKIVYLEKTISVFTGHELNINNVLSNNKQTNGTIATGKNLSGNNLNIQNITGSKQIDTSKNQVKIDTKTIQKPKEKTIIYTNKKGKIFVIKEINKKYIFTMGKTTKEFNNKQKAIDYGMNLK